MTEGSGDITSLAAPAKYEQSIKKSSFVAVAAPVTSADAALAFFDRVSVTDANHNCWAFRVGQIYRFNDDGEPAGSAGRPILAAIDGQGIDQVAVVVTRWFGGVKLGVGGLIRAYGGCAASCLRQATKRIIVATIDLRLTIQFDDLGRIYPLLERFGATKHDEQYNANGATLNVTVAMDERTALAQQLTDATGGRVLIEPIEQSS